MANIPLQKFNSTGKIIIKNIQLSKFVVTTEPDVDELHRSPKPRLHEEETKKNISNQVEGFSVYQGI